MPVVTVTFRHPINFEELMRPPCVGHGHGASAAYTDSDELQVDSDSEEQNWCAATLKYYDVSVDGMALDSDSDAARRSHRDGAA